MKNLILACFCIFSFEEAFSQARFIDTDREAELRKQSGDEVVTGQSATDRRTHPAGSMKGVKKSDSIKGANCMDTNGREFAPNSRGYKRCVDNANRVQ